MKRIVLLFLLCFSACSQSRTGLPPDKALLGHWRDELNHKDCYISSEHRTEVKEGTRNVYPYNILGTNINESFVRISEYHPEWNGRRTVKFIFDSDRKKMIEQAEYAITGTEERLADWVYIDNKQEP